MKTNKMKTRKIDELKSQWRSDSRLAKEAEWTRQQLRHKWKRADELGCSPIMVEYLEILEARIKQLESL